jgi:hypothetical protein
MKPRIWKSMSKVVLVSVLAMASVVFLTPTLDVKAQKQGEQVQSESQARKLEGTWRVQVTLRVCQTGAEIRTFPALATFATGGTINASTAASSPARVTPDYGTWRHTGGHTFAALSEAFLFNPAGDWIGTQRVARAIEIGEDPDNLNVSVSTEIFDINGNLLATGCATAVGHRLE